MYAVIAAAADVAAASARTTAAARFFCKCSNASGLHAVFFCIQNLWPWILAKLQDSMLSVMLHMLQEFKFSRVFSSWVALPLLPQLLLHLLRPLQ